MPSSVLEISVGHQTLSDQILKMSGQFRIMVGYDDRTSHQHIFSYLIQGVVSQYIMSSPICKMSDQRFERTHDLWIMKNYFQHLKPGGMELVFPGWSLHCGWNCIRVVQNLNFVALVCFLCEPGLICNNTRQELNSLLQTYPFVSESQHSTCQWRVTRKLQRKRSYVGSWGELQSWIVITTKCNSDLTIAQWAHITCGAATAKLIPFIHTYATILTAIVEANVPFTASRGYQVRSSKVTLKTNFYIMQKEILWRKERKPYSVTCDWYKSTLLKIKLST